MKTFETKTTLTNGNILNSSNWNKVYAVSLSSQCKVTGVKEIDFLVKSGVPYHEKWKLVQELPGFIFREIKLGTGINGHHKTPRAAIIAALQSRNKTVFIDD